MTTLRLRPGVTHRVLAGHCWIYESEIGKLASAPSDGSVVKVVDERGRFVGVGFYNSKSRIRVRLLSRHNDDINRDFLRARLRAAWDYRRSSVCATPDTACCRVVASEADFLPGLVVDKYGDHLVLQTLPLGMDQRKADLVALLVELFQPRAIIERNDAAVRRLEGLPPLRGVLHGQTDGNITVEAGGLKFTASLLEGHKTGFYLDQRLNYGRVAAHAAGKRVLDAFSYMGAFALHCAKAGARQVLAVEIDPGNVAAAQANAAANGLADRIECHAQNAFDYLAAATGRSKVGPSEKTGRASRESPSEADSATEHGRIAASGSRRTKASEIFDLIILDPPSFTRTRANVPEALRGYKEIHVRALKMLAPGGLLATFCCSHHVSREMFEQIIAEASGDTRRDLRLLERLSQSPDHPILPAVPETEYLKGAIFQAL
ncbi:MAG: class I SAM-dependent rRNA methyltransferase [Verrucomicrobiae bacterium]|nr:class I SAM-dependent rRNA methyltransferase [Verrucomicrobiae bacterium]